MSTVKLGRQGLQILGTLMQTEQEECNEKEGHVWNTKVKNSSHRYNEIINSATIPQCNQTV